MLNPNKIDPGEETNAPPARWKIYLQRTARFLRRLLPFGAGIAAAFAAIFLYNLFFPGVPQLSITEVNQAVAQAMSSATPEPAYSAQVYRAVQPSLVLIQARGADADGEPSGRLGSGVIVTAQGDILTSLHVVEDLPEIVLTFADGTQSTAQIVSEQPENDIAVLHADQPPQLIIPAVLGNPGSMSIGDEAYVVGNPFGLYGSMSAGVISGFNRSFQIPDSEASLDGLIQIDTAVNPGNSGGPLLNRSGHVIGIVVGILNPTEDEFFIGIGFAVPIQVAVSAAGSPPY
jgi:S1-C subfamily serine protease